MKLNKVLLVYQIRNSSAHIHAKNVLKKQGIKFKSLNRNRMKLGKEKKFDLVVTVGGDGTYLRTSHFIKTKVPVLGMNANPQKKVGFYSRCSEEDFTRKIEKIIRGKFRILKLSRLKCVLNEKELPFLALNEFFVSHSIPYKLSRYRIDGEFQRSSGVIIGTATGSYAWIKSAGGKTLPMTSSKFQYIVREVYEEGPVRRRKGILEKDDNLTLLSEMRNGIIVVDCLSNAYHLKQGDRAVFSQSDNHLNFVDF